MDDTNRIEATHPGRAKVLGLQQEEGRVDSATAQGDWEGGSLGITMVVSRLLEDLPVLRGSTFPYVPSQVGTGESQLLVSLMVEPLGATEI